jgi:hypothetical protein
MSIRKLGVSFEGAQKIDQTQRQADQDKSVQQQKESQERIFNEQRENLQRQNDQKLERNTRYDKLGQPIQQAPVMPTVNDIPELKEKFGYHALGTPDYVVSDANILQRMSGAPEDIKILINEAIEKRDEQQIRLQRTVKQEQLNRLAGDEIQANMLTQRATIQRMLVNAQNTELNVAFFFGKNINEFDSPNPDGRRQKFRTDIETLDFMVEVTIGQRKSIGQLNDYAEAKTMKQELIMYAPNMQQGFIDNHVSSRGFHHVKNFAELSATIQKIQR